MGDVPSCQGPECFGTSLQNQEGTVDTLGRGEVLGSREVLGSTGCQLLLAMPVGALSRVPSAGHSWGLGRMRADEGCGC